MDTISINVPGPNPTIQQLVEQYLNQLNEKERHAYEIAKSHLGTSFQLEKSVGFLQWKKKQNSS